MTSCLLQPHRCWKNIHEASERAGGLSQVNDLRCFETIDQPFDSQITEEHYVF